MQDEFDFGGDEAEEPKPASSSAGAHTLLLVLSRDCNKRKSMDFFIFYFCLCAFFLPLVTSPLRRPVFLASPFEMKRV